MRADACDIGFTGIAVVTRCIPPGQRHYIVAKRTTPTRFAKMRTMAKTATCTITRGHQKLHCFDRIPLAGSHALNLPLCELCQ